MRESSKKKPHRCERVENRNLKWFWHRVWRGKELDLNKRSSRVGTNVELDGTEGLNIELETEQEFTLWVHTLRDEV